MKNIKHIVIAAAFGWTLTLSSCSEFMDLEPSTEYTEEMVFEDAQLTQAFVNELYNNIQNGAKEHTLDGLTDDAYFTHNYGQRSHQRNSRFRRAGWNGTTTTTIPSSGQTVTRAYATPT